MRRQEVSPLIQIVAAECDPGRFALEYPEPLHHPMQVGVGSLSGGDSFVSWHPNLPPVAVTHAALDVLTILFGCAQAIETAAGAGARRIDRLQVEDLSLIGAGLAGITRTLRAQAACARGDLIRHWQERAAATEAAAGAIGTQLVGLHAQAIAVSPTAS